MPSADTKRPLINPISNPIRAARKIQCPGNPLKRWSRAREAIFASARAHDVRDQMKAETATRLHPHSYLNRGMIQSFSHPLSFKATTKQKKLLCFLALRAEQRIRSPLLFVIRLRAPVFSLFQCQYSPSTRHQFPPYGLLTSRGSRPKPALRAGVYEKGENCRG
jgi:hypothetical protein